MASSAGCSFVGLLMLIGCFLDVPGCKAASYDIRTFGAVPGANANATNNSAAINRALVEIANGSTLIVPKGYSFHTLGGIVATGKVNITLELNGNLVANPDFDSWPIDAQTTNYAHILHFVGCQGVTISGNGTVDGQGKVWWNRYVFGPCGFEKRSNVTCPHRPKAVVFTDSSDVLIEGITSLNSPSFNIQLDHVARAELRYLTVDTDRSYVQLLKAYLRARKTELLGSHSGSSFNKSAWLQPEDLNTDGIDPAGRDIWIHDVHILNDDDSIAVKPTSSQNTFGPCTENILIEDSIMTGFGASIGSVPPHEDHNCVRNVTFRRISMPNTGKGIYIKSNPECAPGSTAEITNILYEDMNITKPAWWPIWIGPQQQQEPGNSLGDKCSLFYPVSGSCPTQGCVTFANITLRRINISEPLFSPGVILGNSSNPMRNITFDGVTISMNGESGDFPFNKKYKTEYAYGNAIGGSFPDPGLLH